MTSSGAYAHQRVALATRHGKERVISRALHRGLGAQLLQVRSVDTDALGTFCGTVSRQGDAIQACIAKAEAALRVGGTKLAIGSEGSFGPHPQLPFLTAGVECMVFLDQQRGLLVKEPLLARRPNFAHRQVPPPSPSGPDAELERWLDRVGFPGHALMVRPSTSAGEQSRTTPETVAKGLRRWEDLRLALDRAAAASPEGLALLESDMRAHCNPARMAEIRRLAFRLLRRLARPCPACDSPGWGVVDQRPGLPCAACGLPTAMTRALLWGCGHCGHQEEQPRADGRLQADPGHCDWCNP